MDIDIKESKIPNFSESLEKILITSPMDSSTGPPININDKVKVESVSDRDILIIAKQILFGLGFIFILCLIFYFIKPDNCLPLLEIAKVSIPPLAVLIITFYFGRDK